MLDGDGFASAIVDELEVNLEHVYRIAQRTEKARDFFTIVQIIFVDEKKFYELARFLNSVLRKCLICKDLRCAAGRARVSR